MSDIAIHVDGVWKKFRKGEMHDSLRDLIPAMAKRLVGRGPKRDELAEREFWALRDVSFEVPRGQSLGIIGPNGAGKSTMLKLLSRIIRPNRGSYRVKGRLSALIEVGSGMHQDLSGRENIYLNGVILGMPRSLIRRKEEEIIEFAGVREFIDTPVKRYSSGMKARLGFSVAAHLDPEVLLVDEVLSVGDAKFRSKCVRHMRNLIKSDVTVVFISHLLDQVRSLCPDTVVLDRGRLVYHGPTDGAIRVYLDALADTGGEAEAEGTDAQVRNVRLCDSDGREVIEWGVDRPAVIEFELVIRRAVEKPAVQINFATVGGVYLGTANTRRAGVELPGAPGVYPLRFALDPIPFSDGDYQVELQVFAGSSDRQAIWAMRQPRTVTIRAEGAMGAIVRIDGRWERFEPAPAGPASPAGDPR